jgi:hypothetical protein
LAVILSVGDVVAADEGSSNDVDKERRMEDQRRRKEKKRKEDKPRCEREALRC